MPTAFIQNVKYKTQKIKCFYFASNEFNNFKLVKLSISLRRINDEQPNAVYVGLHCAVHNLYLVINQVKGSSIRLLCKCQRKDRLHRPTSHIAVTDASMIYGEGT